MISLLTHIPRLVVVGVDAQNDFCDIPEEYLPPSMPGVPAVRPMLPVTGAHADMVRFAAFIRENSGAIEQIYLSMDVHPLHSIYHPSWWENGIGESPAPFTLITAADVARGVWRAATRGTQDISEVQVRAMSDVAGGLMVWPEHCVDGTWGQAIHADVHAAASLWSRRARKQIQMWHKGTSAVTHALSAFKAEAPLQDDPATQFNEGFIGMLDAHWRRGPVIEVWGGEALSHCVAATFRDRISRFSGSMSQIVLLTDCMSSVPGFEAQGAAFLEDMAARGVTLLESGAFSKVLADLKTWRAPRPSPLTR